MHGWYEGAASVSSAEADTKRLADLARQLTLGRDVDRDGRVTFAPGEAGLLLLQHSVSVLLGAREAAANVARERAR